MLNFAFIFSKTIFQNVIQEPPIHFCDSLKIDKQHPIIARIDTRKRLASIQTNAEYKQIDLNVSDEKDKALLTYDFLYTLEAPFELYNSKRKLTSLKLTFRLRAVIELAINTNPDKHLVGNKIRNIHLQLRNEDNSITLVEQCDEKRKTHDVWLNRVLEQDEFIDPQLFIWEGKINHVFEHVLNQIKTEKVFIDFVSDLEASCTDMWAISFSSSNIITCEKRHDVETQPWFKRLFSFMN